MQIPETITQAETRVWQDSGLYDDLNNSLTSDQYTLTYALRGKNAVNGAYGVDLTAAADGANFKTTISTAQSTNLLGLYSWVAYVQKGGDTTTRIMVGRGEITVLQNIAIINPASAGYDGRSQLEIDLANVDAAISTVAAALATGQQVVKYTIGNRTVEKTPTNEMIDGLTNIRQDLARRLVKQRQQTAIANGEGDPRTVLTRFRSPS